MKVVIIKYNAGNIFSVNTALERLTVEIPGAEILLSDQSTDILSADKIIFPGVGEASSAMKDLKRNKLDQLIPNLTQPFLGICLGLQLMCDYSDENNTKCLGIIPVQVKKFPKLKVPQIGWNNINNYQTELFNSLKQNEYVYFVHSYYAELSEYTIATTDYGLAYSAALRKNNFFAVQFHPEKSAEVGSIILQNFLEF